MAIKDGIKNEINSVKDALILSAKRCFSLGLQTNSGGNLSARLQSENAIVIKPSGIGFNECTRDNLQVVGLHGQVIDSATDLKPSKDLGFHLEIYRRRRDFHAIVHCHSPWATGYASAGLEIPCLTVQTIEKIGRLPLIPLSANGGPQTAEEIGPVFDDLKTCAVVLANHGTIGAAKTMIAAQYLVEIIEETAHIAFVRDTLLLAHQHKAPDHPNYGTPEEVKNIRFL